MSTGNPLAMTLLFLIGGMCPAELTQALPPLQQLDIDPYNKNNNGRLEYSSYDDTLPDQVSLAYLLRGNPVNSQEGFVISDFNKLSSLKMLERDNINLPAYSEDQNKFIDDENRSGNWASREENDFSSTWQEKLNNLDADIFDRSDPPSSTNQKEVDYVNYNPHVDKPWQKYDWMQEMGTLEQQPVILHAPNLNGFPRRKEENSKSDIISKLLMVLLDKHNELTELSGINDEFSWGRKSNMNGNFRDNNVEADIAPTNLREKNGYFNQLLSDNLDSGILQDAVTEEHESLSQYREPPNSPSMYPFPPKIRHFEQAYESSEKSMNFPENPHVFPPPPTTNELPNWPIPYMERLHDFYERHTSPWMFPSQHIDAPILPTFPPPPPPPPPPFEEAIVPLPFYGPPLPTLRYLPFTDPTPSTLVRAQRLRNVPPPFIHEPLPPLHPASYLYSGLPPPLPLNPLPPQNGIFQPIHPVSMEFQPYNPPRFSNNFIPWNLPALRLLFGPPALPHPMIQARLQTISRSRPPSYPLLPEEMFLGPSEPWRLPNPIQMPRSYHVPETPPRRQHFHPRVPTPYAPWKHHDPRVMPRELFHSITHMFPPKPIHL